MRSFVITLLTCSATMSALGIFYMVLSPFLARRYSEKGRYYAWLIIIIGLIIPFRPQFTKDVVNMAVLKEAAASVMSIIPEMTKMQLLPETSGISEVPASSAVTITMQEENILNQAVSLEVPWWTVTVAVWLAGVAIVVIYHGIKHLRFKKMATRWSELVTDEQTLFLLESIKVEMNITKRIRLYTCYVIGSPMLIGFMKPCILLPQAGFAPDELRFILKHELIHYKRGDLWYKFAILIATVIHWFNPAVYLIAKAIDAVCEQSCDGETVRGGDADTRQRYSETIIGVIKYKSKLKTALSTNFYGGKRGMKKRILSIMDISEKKAGVTILCCILALTLGTGMAFAANENEKKNTGTMENAHIAAQNVTNALKSNEPIEPDLAEESIIVFFNLDENRKFYSRDLGKTWMKLSDEEFNDLSHTDQIYANGKWTYDEYKAWSEQQLADLQTIVDSGEAAVYYETTNELLGLTQEDVDKAADLYQSTLEDLKKGVKISKPIISKAVEKAFSTEGIATTVTEAYAAGYDNGNEVAEIDYGKYAPYQLSYNSNTRKLYYKGEVVRYFEDSYPLGEDMMACITKFDKDGTIDVHAVRDLTQIIYNDDGSQDPGGVLTGVTPYSQEEFDARDIESMENPPQNNSVTVMNAISMSEVSYKDYLESESMSVAASYTATPPEDSVSITASHTATIPWESVTNAYSVEQNEDGANINGKTFAEIFALYEDFGIKFDENSVKGGIGNIYFMGELVKVFIDETPDGGVFMCSSSDGGKISIRTLYNESGDLIGVIKAMSST